jgi:hypothetical protein
MENSYGEERKIAAHKSANEETCGIDQKGLEAGSTSIGGER